MSRKTSFFQLNTKKENTIKGYPLKRIKENKKGGASVPMAVMMSMILAISFFNNIVLWGQVLGSEDDDRLKENIEITQIRFNVDMSLVIEVTNVGSVQSHIIAFYIESQQNPDSTFRYGLEEGVNFYLDVGESRNIIPVDLIMNPQMHVYEQFTVTVVTERGNIEVANYKFEESPHYVSQVGERGVFRSNWFYSKYSSLQTDGNISDAVYISKTEEYITFYVEITNSWVFPCKILKDSFLFLSSLQPSNELPNFFIVKEVSYPEGEKPFFELYEEIVLRPEEIVILVFVAKETDLYDWTWGFKYPFSQETITEGSGITISLFYEILGFGDDLHGQTISTQSVMLMRK